MQKKHKRGELISCSSAEEALVLSDLIMITEHRYTDFKFTVNGQTGYWVKVTYLHIPILTPIYAQISNFIYQTIQISKKVFKRLIWHNMLRIWTHLKHNIGLGE